MSWSCWLAFFPYVVSDTAGFKSGLTPKLTGAGARSAQGTNIGHENGEAMANVGVRVERFVRLGRVGRVGQVHTDSIRFECPQKSSKCRFSCVVIEN
jgi:hypothetical protein